MFARSLKNLIVEFKKETEPKLIEILEKLQSSEHDTLDADDIRVQSLIQSILDIINEIDQTTKTAFLQLMLNKRYQDFISNYDWKSDQREEHYFLSRHGNTWLLLQPHLDEIYKKFHLDDKIYKKSRPTYNRLANLFIPDTDTFLKKINELFEWETTDELSALYLARIQYLLTSSPDLQDKLEDLVTKFHKTTSFAL